MHYLDAGMSKKNKNVTVNPDDKELKSYQGKLEKYFNLESTSLNDETREFTFYGSTEQVDRHGDIVLKSSFDIPKIQSLPLLYQHDILVGKLMWAKVDDVGLLCGGRIDKGYEDADRAFLQVKQGSLAFTSIRIVNGQFFRNEKLAPNRIWTNIDLGEISLVSVPSNTGAVIKSFDFDKIQKAFENETDLEYKSIYENIIQNKNMIDDIEGMHKELEGLKSANEKMNDKFNQLNESFNQIVMKDKMKEIELNKSIKEELEKLRKLKISNIR